MSEYFLFDPYEEYQEPALAGYRLRRGKLEAIPPVDGKFTSKKLGITLERDGEQLVLRDAATGQLVYTKEEEDADRERQYADRERLQREAAEAENARLRAELAALRKKKS